MTLKGDDILANKKKEKAEEIRQPDVQEETSASQTNKEPSCDEQELPKEDLQGEIERLTNENAQLKDQLLRTLAEFDNFRKRSQKEKDSIYPDATAKAVNAFLPVKDNFERAFLVEGQGDPQEFIKGMHMVLTQLENGLASLGVTEMGQVGDTFDPSLHNAVMHVEDDQFGENVICEVFQKGYMLKDKVIRHAMVKVAN